MSGKYENLVESVISRYTDNPKNIRIMKKAILNLPEEKSILYQIYNDLESLSIKEVLVRIKSNQYGWNKPIFDKVKAKIDEYDDYLENPFEVVEGVITCPKCKCNKTFSSQKQVRSSDEPMTTFSRCSKCNHTWTYSG